MPACSACRYYEEFYPAADDEPGRGLCGYPASLLPLSMAGYALRERETVIESACDCPVWTSPLVVEPNQPIFRMKLTPELFDIIDVDANVSPGLRALWAKTNDQVSAMIDRSSQIGEIAANLALARGETEIKVCNVMRCDFCGWNAPRWHMGGTRWVCGICELDVPAPGG